MNWCGPKAIYDLCGQKVADCEMRNVDVIASIEEELGRGKIVKGSVGATLHQIPPLGRALIVFDGHVVAMVDGRVSNLNGYGGEKIRFAMYW